MNKLISVICLLLGCSLLLVNATTRATEMMEVILLRIASESKINNTQTCVTNKVGPGIFNPPAIARAYYVVARAIFNAWSFYDPVATPDIENCNQLPTQKPCTDNCLESDKNETITLVAFHMVQYLLPEAVTIYNVAQEFLDRFGVDVTAIPGGNGSPSGIAKAVAVCLIAEYDADGSNQQNCYADTSNYYPVNDPTYLDDQTSVLNALAKNRYEFGYSEIVRTGFINAPRKFLMPHAGYMKTYAYDHSFNAPPLPSPADFRTQMLDLLDLAATLEDNNGLNKIIVGYWADGPRTTAPPGHWIELTESLVSDRKNYDLDNTVRVYYLVASALYDAGIAVWKQKKNYNSARPATYIPTFFHNLTMPNQYATPYCPAQTIQGYEWQPYQLPTFITPPFGEYVSGHSGFSSASARMLALWTGSDDIPGGAYSVVVKEGYSLFEAQCFANNTNVDGLPCVYKICSRDGNYTSENNYSPTADVTLGPWTTFSEAADQAGISRLYGGIHIMAGNLEAKYLGAAVADLVYAKAVKHVGYYDDSLTSPVNPTSTSQGSTTGGDGSRAATLSSWFSLF